MVQILGYILIIILIVVTCIGIRYISIIPYRAIKQMRIDHNEKKHSKIGR